jgi:hypothetical protein|tara:strand:- start:80 stop:334 length:255 start_codon:yes stop_codon:yes gene_type:complete
MNKYYKTVPVDLSEFQIKDETLKEITKQVQLVSSKQLATIFSKKNDNSFRAARSKGHGFNAYKDPNGNVFYNLPEILKVMRIKL